MSLPYHVDKNGRSFRHAPHYGIRDKAGRRYDLFDTGLVTPPFPEEIILWTEDDKIVFRRAKDLEIFDPLQPEDFIIIAVVVTAVLLAVAAFIKTALMS